MKLPSMPKPGAMPKPGGLPGIGSARAPLPAMTVPKSNPLEKVKPTDDLQTDVDAEISAMDAGFRDRMKQEQQRFDAATGSGEYFVVCFADGAQCTAFMRQLAAHVRSINLETNDLVVDGRDLARFLKFDIPAARAVGREPKIDPDLKKRSREK